MIDTIEYPRINASQGTLALGNGVAAYTLRALSTVNVGNTTDTLDLFEIAGLIGNQGPIGSARLFVEGVAGTPSQVIKVMASATGLSWFETTLTATGLGWTSATLDVRAIRYLRAEVTTAQADYAVDVTIVLQRDQ